ncbi:efflux RND transporter periplasmic adaptor subunit [Balneolales bacterium ANBcel1]|nr:efflux RND transporter periplasmic adaptor subunit [Balneolales bacterium ANBcel1]
MSPIFRRTLATVLLLAVIGFLLWIRLWSGSGNAQEGPAAGQGADRGSLAVDGFIVTPESFRETVQATGNILADEEIYVRPEVSGRITAIHFREDSDVREGNLLVKMNDAELRQEKRRISYQINLARIREQRQDELLGRNAIAREDYDIVLNELNTLIAQHDRVQALIDQTEIRAPFDGIIGLKEVSTGSYVTPQSTISSLQKIDTIKIEFSIPERFRSSVARGQTVRFRVEGVENEREGEIYAIQPRVDRDTRTLRMRAIADNADLRIFPGAFARVEVDLRQLEDALLIPSEALVPEIAGYKVYLYSGGRVQERHVEIGTRTDQRVVIREGLAPGDTVITTGLLQVRDGMPVRINTATEEFDANNNGTGSQAWNRNQSPGENR